MKKILLGLAGLFVSVLGSAQVIFYVEAPSPNEGNYDLNYATTSAGWGVADLLDPANAVTGTMVMASDGTAADSLVCGAVTNTITGNIAVLYRGTCEFGSKAKHCQDAGAIAVIIINNVPGAPVSMAPGADGAGVTIPVIMISDATGALLKAEIEAGTSSAFIGSKLGYYNYDLGAYKQHIMRPKNFGNIQALSQDASEFDVELGSWVINYGSQTQTNVVLNADVMLGASSLYSASSTPIASILPGDSVFISLPTFSQSSYANGYYDVTYTITSDNADEFDADNEMEADFVMSDTLYSLGRLNATTLQPEHLAFYRGSGSTSTNTSCIVFNDPNASRMAIDGLTFSGATAQSPSPTSIDGEFVQIYAYRWDDVFTDINDAVVSDYTEIATAEYIYTADLQQENIYVPFESPVMLMDDQNYMFCLTTYGANLYAGYDTKMDYTENQNQFAQPLMPGESDGTWYLNGFGLDITPALAAHMFTAQVGLVELPKTEMKAYPNPASAVVNLPIGSYSGNVVITVTDLEGRVVSSQNTAMNGSVLQVDVTTLPTGFYTLQLRYQDGSTEMVKIVVNR